MSESKNKAIVALRVYEKYLVEEIDKCNSARGTIRMQEELASVRKKIAEYERITP